MTTLPIALLSLWLALRTVSWALVMVRLRAALIAICPSDATFAPINVMSPVCVAMVALPPADSVVPVTVSVAPLPLLLLCKGANHHGGAVVEAEARGARILRFGFRRVGDVELDAVFRQQQGIAVGAHLRALAGDRAVGGDDGQVLAGSEGAGARLADGVVFRAVLAVGAELQGGDRHRGWGAVCRTLGLANFPANEAAVLGVLGVFLVGVLEGFHRVDQSRMTCSGRSPGSPKCSALRPGRRSCRSR